MTRTPYFVTLCDEAFYLADSPAEARVVSRLDGEQARQIKVQRNHFIETNGSVPAHMLPDAREAIREAARQLFLEQRGYLISSVATETSYPYEADSFSAECNSDNCTGTYLLNGERIPGLISIEIQGKAPGGVLVIVETKKIGSKDETEKKAFLPTSLNVKVNGFEAHLEKQVGELRLHGQQLNFVQSFSLKVGVSYRPRLSIDFSLPKAEVES